MEIRNSEKAMTLLKKRMNVENIITYLNKHNDCSVIVSAKSKDEQGKYVFLDMQGIEEVIGLLHNMRSRFEEELSNL